MEQNSSVQHLGRNCVGKTVRSLRMEKGLTQDDFARNCQLIGWDISRATLSKIEAGLRCVTDYELVLLAQSLETKESVLLNAERSRVLWAFGESAGTYSNPSEQKKPD